MLILSDAIHMAREHRQNAIQCLIDAVSTIERISPPHKPVILTQYRAPYSVHLEDRRGFLSKLWLNFS